MACVDDLLTPAALAQLQRFCLRSTVWRRSYRQGYLGAYPEFGFFNPLLLQLAAELKAAVPELLGEHHLTYWWSFVYQHQRPGTDIHADQSDISLNLWITPDSANLGPEGGGSTCGTSRRRRTGHSTITMPTAIASGAPEQDRRRQKSYPYAENRGLLFKGTLFHETSTAVLPMVSRTGAATSPCCSGAARRAEARLGTEGPRP